MEPRPHERGKPTVRREALSDHQASMEPRPHERGKRTFSGYNPRAKTSFNGATSSRTWKALHVLTRTLVVSVLQWSHVLTNVESRSRSVLLDLELRFNGATSSRTWKEGIAWSSLYRNNGASMEPRPHERGKAQKEIERLKQALSFNGATSSRTWKGVSVSRAFFDSESFNGATSSRTWKGPNERP